MNYKKIIRSQQLRFKILEMLKWIPDSWMLPVQYKIKLGRWPNMKTPKRWTEKLQLYKMYYRNPALPRCVDKYEVRNYIEEERLQNIYRNLHSGRKVLVTPFYKPIEEIIDEFEKIEYKSKEFTEDDTTSYYTVKGERVRSKSEKIIADELYRCGVPYKYELPIELQGWNKMIEIYPDFTVLNRRTGKKWILEHFGMMDNPDYYQSAMQKLDTYEKNDILLGRDLLILHETSTSPLNTTVLQKYITQYWC